jgi:peptidyl-dipeptidase Dcp
VLTNRAVREKLMALSLARGSHGGKFDNTQVVLRWSSCAPRRPR